MVSNTNFMFGWSEKNELRLGVVRKKRSSVTVAYKWWIFQWLKKVDVVDWQSTEWTDLMSHDQPVSTSTASDSSHTPISHDRHRDRSPPRRAPDDGIAWRTASQLNASGLPMPVLQAIESWLYKYGISAHVLKFTRGRVSAIVTMTGTCFHCLREHENNHWVLIATPGFNTVRILCHSTGKVENQRAPFVSELLNLM